MMLAVETSNPYIGTEPNHLPFVVAARVLFFKANYITQFYFHNHVGYPTYSNVILR
jgi:hypothetical protein